VGWGGGATKLPTNKCDIALTAPKMLATSGACMHARNWISVNKNELARQLFFFSFHNCCKHAYLDMIKKK
jgi:hypothetical protein